MRAAGLVVAAGVGKRMGGDRPKQFLSVCGRPILAHTLAVFSELTELGTIHVGVAPGEERRTREEVLPYLAGDGRFRIFSGGVRRQDTVRLGLAALAGEADWVVIHDGVRPLVTAGLIREVLAAARQDVGAICALPASDTLKRVGPSGFIEETLSREGIWLAQTPQAFRVDALIDAHKRSEQLGIDATDDAALLEHFGHKIRVVAGDPKNLKITTRDDLPLAEFILSRESEDRS